jgi:peptidoglycan lytic transglycosylase
MGERPEDRASHAVAPATAVDPATQARADTLARTVEAKAKRTEKAEGTQNLVQDRVAVKTGPDGQAVVEQTGEASWYGQRHHGKKTASGRRFDANALTAAHPTFPLGSRVTVTSLATGKSVQVVISDRGPFVKGRDIDLSRAAAQALGVKADGTAAVRIDAVVTPVPERTGAP